MLGLMENSPNPLDDFDEIDDEEEPIELEDVTSAFVTDTDWTTETILSQMRRGNIHLNPRFQRRDAWTKTRKSRFVESLILGLPIPQLVLAEDKRRRGSFVVLDGKQRLLTLSQFAAGSSFGERDGESLDALKLTGLEVKEKEKLTRKSLHDLESDPAYIDELNSFLNQTIRTVVVRNWPDEAFLNLVFLRLNTGSVSLSPQELRQALHPGPFTDFIDDHASESKPLQEALNISRPDFRMRDVELLLRHFAYKEDLGSYRGTLKKFLDDASDRLNSQWSEREDSLRQAAEQFDLAIAFTLNTFGNDAFRKWTPERGRFETRFNRAVFEIMTYYLSDPRLREAITEQEADLKLLFRRVSDSSPAFVDALQSSTKTLESVTARFSTWGTELRQETGIDFGVPAIGNDGILRLDH